MSLLEQTSHHHYPAISSAKYYLLIWRPNQARNGTLLDKSIAYCLPVIPDKNIKMLSVLSHF